MNITTTVTATVKGYTVNHGELTYNLNAGWTHINTYSAGGYNPANGSSDLPVISRHKSAAAAAKAAEADRATFIETIDLEAATAEPKRTRAIDQPGAREGIEHMHAVAAEARAKRTERAEARRERVAARTERVAARRKPAPQAAAAEPAEVVPGAGCGTGSDGQPCSPAYLCPACIDLLLAQEAADIAAEDAERAAQLEAVRDIYGDQAAELVEAGWTVDSAISHVTGVCDLEVCGGDHGSAWATLVSLTTGRARAAQAQADNDLARSLAAVREAAVAAGRTDVVDALDHAAQVAAVKAAATRRPSAATLAKAEARSLATSSGTTPRPRCYREFCCNVATIEVVVTDRSATRDREPIAWGWCTQHVPADHR